MLHFAGESYFFTLNDHDDLDRVADLQIRGIAEDFGASVRDVLHDAFEHGPIGSVNERRDAERRFSIRLAMFFHSGLAGSIDACTCNLKQHAHACLIGPMEFGIELG